MKAGWCPLSIWADTGQTKEFFVDQCHFPMSPRSQHAFTQEGVTKLSCEVWECKAHQLERRHSLHRTQTVTALPGGHCCVQGGYAS